MDVLPTYIYTMYMQYSWRSEEGVESPGTAATDVCELCVLRPKPRISREERPVLLTSMVIILLHYRKSCKACSSNPSYFDSSNFWLFCILFLSHS